MSKELVFYTNPMSRGRVVRWMLEEVGAPYRTEILDYETTMKGPAYLAINPMGKVPAIRHGEVVVTETAAICAYLADAFPEAALAPPPAERGDYYRWLFFAAGPVESAVMNKAMGWMIPQERSRMSGYGGGETWVDVLEGAVSKSDFLAGSAFTAADVYVGAQLGWAMQFNAIEKRPAFERYVNRIHARPAAIRAREIDDGVTPTQA